MVLFWREKVGIPAGIVLVIFLRWRYCDLPGILPRAFSDIPRSCVGTASSTPPSIPEETDDACEGSVAVDSGGVAS